jgi:O-antigen/teichoic acid export membrane protein
VAPITIVVSIVLLVLGLIGFLLSQPQSPTALIPAGFGAVLLLLGLLARQEKMRKHAMHTAVLIALAGLIGAVVMLIRALSAETIERPLAFTMQALMALTLGVFVALCVKSFIDARRKREPETPV